METNRSDRLRNQTSYWGITLAAVLVTAFVLVQPLATTYAVTTEAIPAYGQCLLNNDDSLTPEDSIEQNTVVGTDGQTPIAKTVHAEKEIYNCTLVQSGIEVIVEQTIFAEIYENMATKSIIRKQVEVVTCVKDEDAATVIGCKVNNTVGKDPTPLVDCFVEDDLQEFPMEMDTVVSKTNTNIVKTVESEKEVFGCDTAASGLDNNDHDKKVDIVIFTEIWEDLNKLPSNPVVKKTFLSLRCVTILNEDLDGDGNDDDDNENRAIVESCIFSNVPT